MFRPGFMSQLASEIFSLLIFLENTKKIFFFLLLISRVAKHVRCKGNFNYYKHRC